MRGAAAAALLIAAILIAPAADALDPERSIYQYKHARWTATEGAPPTIYALAQGADGYLWIGSAAGLYRFDGVTFEPIPLRVPDASSWRASALLAARDGTIWVGYSSGEIATYRGGVLRTDHAIRRTNADAYILNLRQTRDGAIWTMLARADRWLLRRGADGRWQEVGTAWGLAGETPLGMLAASDGALWVVTGQAIHVLREGAKRFERVRNASNLGTLSEDAAGRIWLSDDFGSRIISGGAAGQSDTVFPTPDFPAYIRVTRFDKDGNLWGVNGNGLFRLQAPGAALGLPPDGRAARVERYNARDGLTGDLTLPLLEDREGNIWVGTTLGLDQFRAANVVVERQLVAMPSNGFGLLAASDGSVYAGTADGVFRVAPGGRPQLLSDALGADMICEAADGSIVAFATDRAFRFQQGRFAAMPVPVISDNLSRNGGLNACATDNRGTLWANAREEGVFSLAPRGWQHHPPPPEGPWAATLIRDKDGGLVAWLNSGALARLDADGRPGQILLRRNLSDVRFLHQGRRDLWLGGVFGLGRLRDGMLQTVTAVRFPWLADPSDLIETPEGQSWLIGPAGIVGLATAALDHAFADPKAKLQPILFSFEDGLPNARSLFDQRGVVRGGDGRLWFSTLGGVVWIDPARLHRNRVPPPVAIRALVAGGLRHRDPAQVTLPKGTSRIAIQYTGLSLTLPQRMRFRYRLEGVDDGWVDAGAQREAAYTSLGPGTYRFRVIAANNDGVWNRDGAPLEFTIPPTFLQSSGFKLLCVLAAGLLLWLLHLLRVRQLKARLQGRFEIRIAERERIARELHDTLLQGFQGLMLFFQSVATRIPADSDLREPIEKALDRADKVLVEGRDRVHELRSDAASHDLAQALRDAVAEIIPGDAPRFQLVVEGPQRPLHGLVGEEMLRIAQEAVRNAVQHAQATSIEAILIYGRRDLRLVIRDDGVGIADETLRKGWRDGHYGLVGMRERADQIGGRLVMARRAGGGTEVILSVPGPAAYRGRRTLLLDWLRRTRLQD